MVKRSGKAGRRSSVVRGSSSLTGEGFSSSAQGVGVRVYPLLGAQDGATHISAAVIELAPGAEIVGALHPFEESFYVLEGEVLLALEHRRYALVADDFGLVPLASGHAWANPSSDRARLLRIYSPQPQSFEGRAEQGVYAAPDVEVPTSGEPVDELHPRHRGLGHFSPTDLPQPGPICIPGYHGARVSTIAVRVMIDELAGARHHTMFVVEAEPTPAIGEMREHLHPFEELYYFLSGEAVGSFDGDQVLIGPGDLVFSPTGATHAFRPVGDVPARWIEVQAPLPPAANGFTFLADWDQLTPLG